MVTVGGKVINIQLTEEHFEGLKLLCRETASLEGSHCTYSRIINQLLGEAIAKRSRNGSGGSSNGHSTVRKKSVIPAKLKRSA